MSTTKQRTPERNSEPITSFAAYFDEPENFEPRLTRTYPREAMWVVEQVGLIERARPELERLIAAYDTWMNARTRFRAWADDHDLSDNARSMAAQGQYVATWSPEFRDEVDHERHEYLVATTAHTNALAAVKRVLEEIRRSSVGELEIARLLEQLGTEADALFDQAIEHLAHARRLAAHTSFYYGNLVSFDAIRAQWNKGATWRGMAERFERQVTA